MEDGNSAALRAHEASEARAEEMYEAYAERVIEGVVDDVMSGKGIRNSNTILFSARDFLSEMLDDGDIDIDDIVTLVVFSPSYTSDNVRTRLLDELTRRVKFWCKDTTRGQELVMERCREWDRDARGES